MTYSRDIQVVIQECDENIYVNNFNNFKQITKFFKDTHYYKLISERDRAECGAQQEDSTTLCARGPGAHSHHHQGGKERKRWSGRKKMMRREKKVI